MQQEEPNKYVKELTQEKYKYGFTTEVHTDVIERGLNEAVSYTHLTLPTICSV